MKRTKIEGSTNVESIGHEGDVMEVEYKHGGVYQFSPVSASRCEEVRSAASVGKALNSLGVKGTKIS